MWSRVVEVMLGCWLLMSPFIFGHPSNEVSWWVTDFGCGLAIIVLALLSYWNTTRHAHLLATVIGAALILMAYLHAGQSAPPATQNQAVLGLLLLMLALVPNEASRPPLSWRTETVSSRGTKSRRIFDA